MGVLGRSPGVAWRFSFDMKLGNLGLGQSLDLCVSASAFGLSEQTTDPANQSLDESVAGADLAVQTLHLQKLPLQNLSETCGHVALQLRSHKQKTVGSGII